MYFRAEERPGSCFVTFEKQKKKSICQNPVEIRTVLLGLLFLFLPYLSRKGPPSAYFEIFLKQIAK
jgi:ABC-type tungstate transport system substrate-binding protein